LTGPVNFFVSHAWRYKFGKLVEAIERFEKASSNRAGAYYFIDYFAINQWEPTEDLKSLGSLVQKSEALIFVMSSLKKSIAMMRCWCLYELFIAIKYNVPIHLAVPEEELSYLTVLLQTSRKGEIAQFEVDSKNAEASKESDEDMIKTAIKQSIGFD